MALLGGMLASALFGSGCSETHARDLTPPVYSWTQLHGLCDSVQAVDADRKVWVSRGCEDDGSTGLEASSTMTVASYTAMLAGFEALHALPPVSRPACGIWSSFWERLPGDPQGTGTYWGVCGPMQEDDASTLGPPYRAIAQAFMDPGEWKPR